MTLNNILKWCALTYVFFCVTVREYYLPFFGVNFHVLISLIYVFALISVITIDQSLSKPSFGVVVFSIYWFFLIIITIAGLVLFHSINVVKYLLFLIPILSISCRFGNDRIFMSRMLLIIKFGVIINLFVVFMSIIDPSLYSSIRNFLSMLSNTPSNFIVEPSMRSQGIFYNSSSLAALGLFTIGFHLLYHKNNFTWLLIAASLLVLVSGSRVPLVCLMIFLCFYKGLNIYKISVACISVSVFIFYVDIEILKDFFSRVIRLYQNGLLNDYSLSYRLHTLWPHAIDQARDYIYGTLSNPVEIIGTIDSGYLTSYIQGRWILVMALIFSFLALFFVSILRLFFKKDLFFFLIPLYLMVGMSISNPISDPLIVLISFLYMARYTHTIKITNIKA